MNMAIKRTILSDYFVRILSRRFSSSSSMKWPAMIIEQIQLFNCLELGNSSSLKLRLCGRSFGLVDFWEKFSNEQLKEIIFPNIWICLIEFEQKSRS